MKTPNNLLHEIEAKAHLKDWAGIKGTAARLQPADIADLFSRLPAPSRVLLFRSLPRQLAADTFSFLHDDQQIELLKQINEQETRDLLADLSADDRTELFEELPAAVTQKLLNLLPPEERREALRLLGYPPGSVGRLMSPDFAAVNPDLTVGEALEAVRRQATDSETINMVYVVDSQGRLVDEIRLRRLLLAPASQPLHTLLDGSFRALTAFDPKDAAVALMKKTGLFALPVTDSEGVLLGVVTADDVLDVAIEGATEDFHKGGGMKPLDMSYLQAPLKVLYRRRISWLIILVFMNIFSGAGIALFEELIEAVVALVFFLPLLVDSGGNSGSQAATLVIRSMALNEVRLTDYFRVAWREVRVAFGLGLSMAAAVFFLAWWRSGVDIAVVVSLAMVAIVVLGSLVGMSLPFILRKIGQDPAAASAPLVTSLADILGVLIYLGIASAMLGPIAGH
jgi:magnesium transporter